MTCAHGDVIRENNALRKRNEGLLKTNERLTEENRRLHRQLQATSTMAEHWRIHSSTQHGGES